MAEGLMAGRGLSLVAVAQFALGGAVAADEARPSARRVLVQSVGASYNRLGLQHVLGARWARPLFESSHPLLLDAHLAGGATHILTPSYTRLGVWAEVGPLSILDLRAGVEPGVCFGTFGSLMSFPGYDSDFSDDARDRRKSEARAGTGTRAYVAPTLKLRFGSFAALGEAALEWWRSSATGPLYWEPSRDVLLKTSGDRLLTISAALVRQLPKGAGARFTYGLSYELTDVPDAPANRSQKVGVVLSRRLASNHLGLGTPSIGVRLGYYLDHPSRRHQLTAAVGVSVERGPR